MTYGGVAILAARANVVIVIPGISLELDPTCVLGRLIFHLFSVGKLGGWRDCLPLGFFLVDLVCSYGDIRKRKSPLMRWKMDQVELSR